MRLLTRPNKNNGMTSWNWGTDPASSVPAREASSLALAAVGAAEAMLLDVLVVCVCPCRNAQQREV